MYKYRVVIADDQLSIRNGIEKGLQKYCENLEIDGVYTNGADVLFHLEKKEVDILIVDIKMPDKTGIDIAQYVFEKKLACKMIIITGFREFEYAQKALEYGACALLSKPVDFSKLLQTIENITNELDSYIDKIHTESKQKLLMRNLKRQDFGSLITGVISAKKILDERDFLFEGMPLCKRTCATIVFDFNYSGGENLVADHSIGLKWQDMGEIETEVIDIYFINRHEKKATFFIIMQTEDMGYSKDLAEQYALEIKENMRKCYNIESNFETTIYSSIEKIKSKDDQEILNQYIEYLLKSDVEARKNILKSIIYSFDLEKFCTFIENLFIYLETKHRFNSPNIASDIKAIDSVEEATRILYLLDDKADAIAKNEQIRIFKIVSYINENCTAEDISLENIADKFNMTSSYLSRLFKKRMGENFAKYITRLRINKAKELLITRKYSIKDVSSMVGYPNPEYLRKIFKENVGMTPQQYMSSQS